MVTVNVLSHNTFNDRAARAAGWSGVALPELKISRFKLVPVVVIDHAIAQRRLRAGHVPETDMSTLAVWEGWSRDLGAMPPESPVSITGFISTATPRFARYALDVLAGYGAGLILATGSRRPSEWTMRECELADISLVWGRGGEHELLVQGRQGPVATSRRTVATRQKEELLFSHALRSGLVKSTSGVLRG